MAVRISKTERIARANTLMLARNGGVIELYTGAIPATVDAAITSQILLGTFVIPATAGTIDANAVFTAAAIAAISAVAAGTVTWYRQSSSSPAPVSDGTVTATGGGGDMIIDNTNVANGQTINMISWTETEGNGD